MMQSYVLVRLRRGQPAVRIGRRRLIYHGQFANLYALPHAKALRLIEAGVAKLPKHLSLRILRDEVAPCCCARHLSPQLLSETLPG